MNNFFSFSFFCSVCASMTSFVPFSFMVVRFQIGSGIRELDALYPLTCLHFQKLKSGGCLFALFKQESDAITSSTFLKISNKTRGHEDIFWPTFYAIPITCEDHSCVYHIPLKRYQFEMESGEEMEVYIISQEDIEVKKCVY
jgi:hypothetical protein